MMALPSKEAAPATVGALLRYLAPRLARRKSAPRWPPDAFALAAAVLHRSGGYRSVVGDWPPPPDPQSPWNAPDKRSKREGRWETWIERVGSVWRKAWKGSRFPNEVDRWWQAIREAADIRLGAVAESRELCWVLLQLAAAADAACGDIGVAGLHGAARKDPLVEMGNALLEMSSRGDGSSLCTDEIRPWTVRILPKMHTPQSGITLRSLSLHLAFCPVEEVIPRWLRMPGGLRRPIKKASADSKPGAADPRLLNALIVPWPLTIDRDQFSPVASPADSPRNMASRFGFFRFRKPSEAAAVVRRLDRLFEAAQRQAGRIDMVVFPELALDSEEHDAVQTWARSRQVLVIAGVGRHASDNRPEENLVAIDVPWTLDEMISVQQPKHHRWQLDRSQVETYGLGGHLRSDRLWWEFSRIDERALYFVSVGPWLTLCVLVCEDLAQQEPVARMVRAVGPNLVIAVLMDGPQLAARWPARYATVLAEDPGSSVLTVTSLGMCERSLPPGKPPSRVVAMWKDSSPRSWGPRELSLEPGAEGLVLNLLLEKDEEYTADGRGDGGEAGRPVLVGAYSVKVSEKPSEPSPQPPQ